jgi:hypothetical protein
MLSELRLKNQGYKLSAIIALWRMPCKLTAAFTAGFVSFATKRDTFDIKASIKNSILACTLKNNNVCSIHFYHKPLVNDFIITDNY